MLQLSIQGVSRAKIAEPINMVLDSHGLKEPWGTYDATWQIQLNDPWYLRGGDVAVATVHKWLV